MSTRLSRRRFFTQSATTGAALTGASLMPGAMPAAAETKSDTVKPLKLGLMTYLLAHKWDIETLIANMTETKYEHAELRTTHAHGVEVSLSKQERQDVRKRFEDAGIKLSLASAFAYHFGDPAELRRNIEGTKEYTLLAKDIGALGIRVFPNALTNEAGMSEEAIIEQIGKSASEVADFAADYGVEIRLANHGRGTNRIAVTRRILDHVDSPHLRINWNCDRTDIEEPGFEAHFDMVKDRIGNVHMHNLADGIYPYRKLFTLLREAGYQGYCDAEVAESPESIRFMQYYRALFLALQNAI